MKDFELAELRAFIAALAFGEPIERLRSMLSPTLVHWLEQVRQAHGGTLDVVRLLDILRSTFAFELDYIEPLSLEAEDRLHRLTHFVWGGSEVHLPTRIPHVRMPSMAEGLVSRLARWRQI